ncbi:MAG TPA: glycosyl hydrolase family 2 [Acidobacteriaceae bacterium]
MRILPGILASLALAVPLAHAQASRTMEVREGWTLRSACTLQAAGAELSTAAYVPMGWALITVPSTVLAAQVSTHAVPDPYYGTNLRGLPGTSYPLGANFSNLPMPPASPYACGWWYRTRFHLAPARQGGRLWLHLGGINYRAALWINGRQVASDRDLAGAYRTYDLDVTDAALPGRENVLAIETFAPTEKDLGINWVDWNPCPPDKDMGVTGPVSVHSTGPVAVRYPMVSTHFADGGLSAAELSIHAEVENADARPVAVTVQARLLGLTLLQRLTLAAHERRTLGFEPAMYPELRIAHPQPWWPYQMGEPHLETLRVTAQVDLATSDDATIRFGIREITSELTATGSRLFRVNGQPVFIRGAGWSQDMLLREDPKRLRDQFSLVRDLGLNTLRLEGKLETEDFLTLADEQGILLMAGWCCCDQWEQWDKWTPENYAVAAASLRAQMLRLRSHPSLLVWLNGSDNPPPSTVESTYLGIERETLWPNPTLSSASARVSAVTGPSGVKMTGPYDFVAPSYWVADKDKYGGAYGFNTETSPGPSPPLEPSLARFLPAAQQWPPADAWQYHNGSGEFAQLTAFDTAMQHTYGLPHSLAEYERYAQTMAYDGERAMFEAYARERYTRTTGVVQWMLNNAWPSMIWHLYDYYLDAGGGYYGARKANEALHVQYSYDDRSVVVINNTSAAAPALRVVATVYDLDLHPQYTREENVTLGADSSTRAFLLPEEGFASPSLHFVELALLDAQGSHVSDNFYWVPAALTTFDWPKTNFTHTPAASYEDLTALAALPAAHLAASLRRTETRGVFALELRNTSPALAFAIHARAVDGAGQPVAPAFWSDNYIALLPGEARRLTVHAAAAIASVTVSGWNLAPQQLAAPARAEGRR